jgi:ankyrin repeat protein
MEYRKKTYPWHKVHSMRLISQIEFFCDDRSEDVHEKLVRAVVENDIDTVCSFLAMRECDMHPPTKHGWSPFHISIILKRETICNLFVNSNGLHGDIFNMLGPSGEQPLHVAAAMGIDFETFFRNYFTHGGSKPCANTFDFTLKTPLEYAIAYRQPRSIRCLTVHGASIRYIPRHLLPSMDEIVKTKYNI